MGRTIIVLSCILLLLSSCTKNTTAENVSHSDVTSAVPAPVTEEETYVEEEEEPLFQREGKSIVSSRLLEGEMSLTSGRRGERLDYSVRITKESISFILHENGEERDLSTIDALSESYSVRFTTSDESYLHTGTLTAGENGVMNVISVDFVTDEFCSSGCVSVKIYNEYGTYMLDDIDTTGLDELIYDFSGYTALIEEAEKLQEKGEYSEALGAVRTYKAEHPYTFSFYGGEEYLEEYRENMYQEAVSLYRNGEYEKAAEIIMECGTDYRDLSVLYLNCVRGVVGEFRCGDTIEYGTDENGRRIDWIVVAVAQGKVLLLSEDILFDSSFNSYDSSTSWESSTLRKYLNDTSAYGFLGKTFTAAELDSILESVVVSEDSSVYGTYGGGNTVDRVFLMSLTQLTQFSTSADERVARHDGKTHYWWLRTPGEDMSRVTVVSPNGLVYRNGVEASDSHGVRPAMWVSLYKIQL